ncbi:hypothetical protein D9M68_928980 [compost metagenome]
MAYCPGRKRAGAGPWKRNSVISGVNSRRLSRVARKRCGSMLGRKLSSVRMLITRSLFARHWQASLRPFFRSRAVSPGASGQSSSTSPSISSNLQLPQPPELHS